MLSGPPTKIGKLWNAVHGGNKPEWLVALYPRVTRKSFYDMHYPNERTLYAWGHGEAYVEFIEIVWKE